MIDRRGLLLLGGMSLAHPAAAADESLIATIERNLRPRLVIKGQAPSPVTMAERMAHYGVPGVSLAFFDSQHIRWTRSYGVRLAGSGQAVSVDTLFQASSISKAVSAVGVLRLVADGRLSLDEDVNQKLRGWKIPDSASTQAEKVTLRRLLSHSAGVNLHGVPGYATGAPLPTTAQILNGAPPATTPAVRVEATPGSGFRYSGGGYVVLQQLVEDVAGRSFAEVMASAVLSPASMGRSTYAQPLPAGLWRNAAAGHQADGSAIAGGAMVFPELAPAGLWSTPSDLARFAMALNAAAEGREAGLLPTALAREMLTRRQGGWGLGVDVGAPGEERQFSHSGTNPGYQSFLIFWPERREGVAIMTNGANQSGFVSEIAMAVATAYGWPGFRQTEQAVVAVAADVLAAYEGEWLADGAPAFRVMRDAARLFVVGGPFGERPVELHARSATDFFILSTGFSFDFAEAARDRALLGGGIRAIRTARK